MSAKLAKKLKREIKKSPGKAGVLALLAVVALWFWAPLVTGMFGSKAPTTKPASPSAPEANATAATTTAPATAHAAGTVTQDWKQVADAMAKDPRMMPVTKQTLTRDPFRDVKTIDEAAERKKTEAVKEEVVDVPPASVGIVLSSTMVGPRLRVARINGKSYHIGDEVPAITADVSYRVVDISGKSVTLALGERVYEIKMTPVQNTSNTVNVSGEVSNFDPSLFPVEQ